jgi:hypothetical protein
MAAAAILEAVWIYAGMAMFGVLTGQGGSPVSWVASLVVLGTSLGVARTLAIVVMPRWLPYLIQMVAGGLVIYLTIALQVQSGDQGFDLGWVGSLFSDTVPVNYPFSVALAGAFGALLWWRGGRLGSVEYPVEHLSGNFRFGFMVLGLAAVVDVLHPADLKIFPVMFVFFASGLTGLSLGHLLPSSTETAGQRTWPRVIGAVVGTVMVAGLLSSLLARGLLTFVSTPAVLLLKAIATAILYVVVFPLVFIIDILLRVFFGLLHRIFGEPEPLEVNRGEAVRDAIRQFGEDAADGGPLAILQFIEWTLLAVVVLAALYFLARAFRRRVRRYGNDREGMRESLSEEVDPAYDLARLLFNLLPDRLRKRRTEHRLRLPDDDSDIVDVFRVYFGMLTLAEDRGRPRLRSQTPTEYQSSLETVFPGSVVRRVTAAFNRACYGHQPSTRAEIDEMRGALEQATAEGGG